MNTSPNTLEFFQSSAKKRIFMFLLLLLFLFFSFCFVVVVVFLLAFCFVLLLFRIEKRRSDIWRREENYDNCKANCVILLLWDV